MKAYKKCARGRENLDLVQWLEPQVNVMIDFQAAEKKRHEEPASEVGLEPLCAMINNNLRCYDLAMELSNSTLEALPQNYAEQDQELCLITQQKSKDADKKE